LGRGYVIPEKQDILKKEKDHGKRGVTVGTHSCLFVRWE
jgi:hypothetical protein